mmetsp:Transcript_31340/g.51740  ORF Transcript_31340/g.51740 Transcript_31340/m.51740 type:complete len:113 (-) Transcript_31340:266-604(-)
MRSYCMQLTFFRHSYIFLSHVHFSLICTRLRNVSSFGCPFGSTRAHDSGEDFGSIRAVRLATTNGGNNVGVLFALGGQSFRIDEMRSELLARIVIVLARGRWCFFCGGGSKD